MAHQLFKLPRPTAISNNLTLVAGAKVSFFLTGTSTPSNIFQDSGLTTPHTNPVVADAAGRLPAIYLDPDVLYRVTFTDSNDVEIYPAVDPVNDSPVTADSVVGFLSQSIIGGLLYPRTSAEISAGVTPANYFYPPGHVLRYGTNTTPGTTNMTAAIQAAHDQGDETTGARPYLPAGSYLITTAINPCVMGMYGDGSKSSLIICNACNAFTIPSDAGLDRPQVVFESFGIDSNNGTSCDGNWAFYFGGVASGAAAVYNSGVVIRDIEVGRNNRMGGGFYVKDVFRMDVGPVGFTSVTRMIQIVGSVVQCTFTNVRANNDSPGSTLTAYGISTEAATYAAAEVRTPENVKFINCAYIRGTQGINHTAGLNVRFIDFDTEATDIAASLGNACRLHGGILAPSPTAADWKGIAVGVNPVGAEDLIEIDGVEINTLNVPSLPASSYGIDMGDGVSPVRNVHIHDVVIQGQANSMADAIRGRICNRLRIENCAVESGICSGTEINIAASERVQVKWNALPDGIIAVNDSGSATAYGEITHNECVTVTATLTTPSNWDIGPNEAITTKLRASELGTYTGTLTGCTTSPTGTIRWERIGRTVVLYVPAISGTSNTTAASVTGMPAGIRPNRTQDVIGRATDNGLNGICGYRVNTSGTIELFFGASLGAFTNSGTKGTSSSTLPYSLD